MIENRIQPKSFEEFTSQNQNLEQISSTLKAIEEKESIEASPSKKLKVAEDLETKKVDSDLQEQRVNEVALTLIEKQEMASPLLSLPQELLFSIFNWLSDIEAFGVCMKVCKAFKTCLEAFRDIKNKKIIRSGLKDISYLHGLFNQLGIIENSTHTPGLKLLKLVQFIIFRDPRNLLKVTFFSEHLLDEQIANVESVLERINEEEREKKRVAKVSDELYTLLSTCTWNNIEGYFDEADRFTMVADTGAFHLQQFQIGKNPIGMWELHSFHTPKGLKPQQKKILKLTIKKINEEIKGHLGFASDITIKEINERFEKQLAFAYLILYPLFIREQGEIWGRFNKEGFLEILDAQINQDYKETFQFQMQKNELEVWELISINEKVPLNPLQKSILTLIRARFNSEEIIDKEVGIWKEIMLKPLRLFTQREKFFSSEFRPFR